MNLRVILLGVLSLLGVHVNCFGQGTAFAYQGQLNDGGNPANGAYDLEFSLFNAITNGDQFGPVATNLDILVSNGWFAVTLDFGGVFDGHNYWLQIGVRTNGAASFVVLNPRQQVTPVPYAIMAGGASNLVGTLPAGQLAGTVGINQLPPTLITNGATGLNLAGNFSGSGTGLSGVLSSSLTSDATIVSMSVADSAPAPASNWTFYPMSQNSSNFLTIGGVIDPNGYAGFGYFGPQYLQSGAGGVPVEQPEAMSETFEMDGSQFVFGIVGQGRTFDVLVNGVDNLVTNTVPADGNFYWFTVTFATTATRTVTIKNAYSFYGVYVPITNGFFLPRALAARMVVLGDSFTEQTYTDGSQCLGLVSQMQTLLPQFDIWALGEGGTGFVNPGTDGRTNFVGRVGDVISAAPQYVLIYGGINDAGYVTDTTVTNPVYINATNLLFALEARLPAAKIAVIGPQWPRTPSPVWDSIVFNCGIVLSKACAICGVPYVSPITPPWITGNVAAPDSGNADVYTLAEDGTHPTVPAGAKYLASQIVSSLSQIWNLSNPASPTSSTGWPIANYVPPNIPAGGLLWSSNNVLYWVTGARTNYLSGL